jgi:hypothetical protein
VTFKADHPNYKTYGSADFHVATLPDGFSSVLQGFIVHHCKTTDQLKAAINEMAGLIPAEPTTNWGRDFLLQDLSAYARLLCKGPLHKVMDFFADACDAEGLDLSVDDVNEFLEEQEIGYVLDKTAWGPATWQLREEVSSRVETIETTAEKVKDICAQTYDHIQQARKHLLNTPTDRDRKDAIRDCLSALEAMLKTLSGKADIKDATTYLRQEKTWGPDIIVKDGLGLWDRVHELYPDVRHGQSKKSDIADEEAIYWMDRITCFIRYISATYERQG